MPNYLNLANAKEISTLIQHFKSRKLENSSKNKIIVSDTLTEHIRRKTLSWWSLPPTSTHYPAVQWHYELL